MIDLEDSAQLRRLIEDLASTILDAQWHWEMHLGLNAALHETSIAYTQAPTFWALTIKAHRITAVQTLCRAFDQHKDALHLYSWLRTIQSNTCSPYSGASREVFLASLAVDYRPPDQVQLASDIELCSKSDPAVRRLQILRSESVAHRNAAHAAAGTSVAPDLQLLFDDVQLLIDRGLSILNRYYLMFFAASYSKMLIGKTDYEGVIGAVAAAEADRRTKIREQLARLGYEGDITGA